MANPHSDRMSASQMPQQDKAPPRRADTTPAPAKPPRKTVSRANEIVRAIGLRPITGLAGPRIGY